jgi:hypothetical protein
MSVETDWFRWQLYNFKVMPREAGGGAAGVASNHEVIRMRPLICLHPGHWNLTLASPTSHHPIAMHGYPGFGNYVVPRNARATETTQPL